MKRTAAILIAWLFLVPMLAVSPANGYILNYTVADLRNSANAGLGACPQPNRFFKNGSGETTINRRWSTSLSTTPVTIFTSSTDNATEIQNTILESFSVWAGVTGTALHPNTNPNALGPLNTTSTQAACDSNDGLNTICFNQSSSAFTRGVLAFAASVTSDILGESLGASGPSAFIGQILDVDIQFRNDGTFTFATPAALSSHPTSFDLGSVLTHELGHLFGMDHSGVWRAMMFPFAPPPGKFLGVRPTPQIPDGPLADDDRTGLRVLYPDPNDTVNVGTISGHILPANPFSLATLPSPSAGQSVTGIFGTHVVAVDADTGSVVAGALGGWSCPGSGPTQFDGFYSISQLPVPRNYKVYVEPLDGPVRTNEINTTGGLCRNSITDKNWPPQFACTAPAVNTNLTTKVRPASP